MEHSIGSSSDPNLAVYELQVYLIRLARYEHALEDSSPCLVKVKWPVVGSFMNMNILLYVCTPCPMTIGIKVP